MSLFSDMPTQPKETCVQHFRALRWALAFLLNLISHNMDLKSLSRSPAISPHLANFRPVQAPAHHPRSDLRYVPYLEYILEQCRVMDALSPWSG